MSFETEFPVWAGMFRYSGASKLSTNGIPRMGGDVPLEPLSPFSPVANSPYGRGCSASCLQHSSFPYEFPVWAGMFRPMITRFGAPAGIPRMGGDVPIWRRGAARQRPNSPYGRGCSAAAGPLVAHVLEFPVWAGMFRATAWTLFAVMRIPRMGGDVPAHLWPSVRTTWNSPYGRGCSAVDDGAVDSALEFPVWAGMFRTAQAIAGVPEGIPRMGGDVPAGH